MLKSLLVKLRKKERPAKEQLAVVLAGLVTLVVSAGWLVTLPHHFSDMAGEAIVNEVPDSSSEPVKEIPQRSQTATVFEATTAVSVNENNAVADIPNEYPTAQPMQPNTRPIRLVTTSSTVASSTE